MSQSKDPLTNVKVVDQFCIGTKKHSKTNFRGINYLYQLSDCNLRIGCRDIDIRIDCTKEVFRVCRKNGNPYDLS